MNKKELVLKPLTDNDIRLIESWLDKDYIKKWFGNKEEWLNEIRKRDDEFHFLTHFIVYHNERKIGFCLYADCFYLKDVKADGFDFKKLYGDVAQENHTFEIGYLIGEEEYLNKGIGKIIIRMLEEKLAGLGCKEIAADPDEKNVISIRTLLSNGFYRKSDGDYRKMLINR